ncbi:short-chain alcohol protein [Purpureocillium lavendulum]|uniref:Short-chain alcohol protein n=1 Tax=Purpureocillium lavendulum TaxID=1247861 RepID=A0AB34FLF2_9HYPO|nr:short-chain alcohol protein [Purpureocillium lavendulum]
MAPERKGRLLVVLGSGPGIGAHVAAAFASHGFNRIALVARNQAKLNSDRAAIEKAAGAGAHVEVGTYATDITDHIALENTLNKMDEEMGVAECVFYNAALVRPSILLETSEADMEHDFKVALAKHMGFVVNQITCTSLHAAAKHYIPHLLTLAKSDSSARPSLLITSSHLPLQPDPESFVLSMTKAAQRNMAESMAQKFGPQGVHVGLVNVSGVVDPDKKQLNARYIADRAWDLFNQPKEEQEFEVVIREEGEQQEFDVAFRQKGK